MQNDSLEIIKIWQKIHKTSSKLVKTHRRNSDINKKLHKDPQNLVKKNW